MSIRLVVIIVTAVLVIGAFVAVIVSLIYFVPRAFFTPSNNVSPSLTPIPTIITSVATTTPLPTPTLTYPSATPSPQISQTTLKLYKGTGFTLLYPSSWSILTCNNSTNFELDPNGGDDEIGIVCTYAQKPITIIVSNNLMGCLGTPVKIGNLSVVRSSITTNSYIEYQWCTVSNPVLQITNRVGPQPSSAIGTVNYSPQIEQMISTITFNSQP